MLTSFLTIFVAIAGIQALFVVKLADALTDGAESRGSRAIGSDAGHAWIA